MAISAYLAAPREKAEARQVVKELTSFAPGQSETDDIVRRWLDRQGIPQNLVSGYSIFRHQGEVPRIMLEMYFDDEPREAVSAQSDDPRDSFPGY